MKRIKQFENRTEAGKALAARLVKWKLEKPVVLALPRGGVPVAVEIARALEAPLDLVLVRKIGVPYQRELAAAAVVDGGDPEIVTNDEVMADAGLSRTSIEAMAKSELQEIERRRHLYLAGRPRIPLDGRVLILVDDGIATGASIRAAITALLRRRPERLIVAVPVAARETVARLKRLVDDVVCLEMPEPLEAVGLHYRDFHQVSDKEVVALFEEGWWRRERGRYEPGSVLTGQTGLIPGIPLRFRGEAPPRTWRGGPAVPRCLTPRSWRSRRRSAWRRGSRTEASGGSRAASDRAR